MRFTILACDLNFLDTIPGSQWNKKEKKVLARDFLKTLFLMIKILGGLSSFFDFYRLSIKRDCWQQNLNLGLDSEENYPYQLNQLSLPLFKGLW